MPQGTIKTFDETTGSGILLDDAKTELPFDRESYGGTPVREFRLGQRVKFRVEGQGERAKVRDLNILTL